MKVYEYSRKFYEDHIAGMIKDRFPEYENRIAVGIAGEGSDCFGRKLFQGVYGAGIDKGIVQERSNKVQPVSYVAGKGPQALFRLAVPGKVCRGDPPPFPVPKGNEAP